MKTITQGRPRSSYFVAFNPPDSPVAIDEEIICHNPRTQEQTHAVCVEYFTQCWSQLPDSFCLLNYGRIARELREEIETKYPGTANSATVRFLLLREIKK